METSKHFVLFCFLFLLATILLGCAHEMESQKKELRYSVTEVKFSSEIYDIPTYSGDFMDVFSLRLQNKIDDMDLDLPLDSEDRLAVFAWKTLPLFHEFDYLPQDYFPVKGRLHSNDVWLIWYTSEEKLEQFTKDTGMYAFVDSSTGAVLSITNAHYEQITP